MDQAATNPLLSPPELSPLEQEVLEEYERLAENMKKVRNPLPLHVPQSENHLSASFKKTLIPTLKSTARLRPRHHGEPADDADPRRPARARAQDEPRLHAAQGQRVQHRAAAGDRLRRRRPPATADPRR